MGPVPNTRTLELTPEVGPPCAPGVEGHRHKPIDSRFFAPHASAAMPSRADMRSTPWGLLGELELAVLECLWDSGGADAKEVHGKLGQTRGITLNTVQSAMKRLHEKALLRRTKVSHAFVYEPALTKEDFQRDAVGEVVEALLHGEADAMVAAFVDVAERAGGDTLAQLERLIADRRRANADTGAK